MKIEGAIIPRAQNNRLMSSRQKRYKISNNNMCDEWMQTSNRYDKVFLVRKFAIISILEEAKCQQNSGYVIRMRTRYSNTDMLHTYREIGYNNMMNNLMLSVG